MSIQSKFKFIFVIVFVVFTSACESKFAEESPKLVSIIGADLDTRVNQKIVVDAKMVEVQKGAVKIKSMLSAFKKSQPSFEASDDYTPVDLLIDINKTLKDKIPIDQDGNYLRFGRLFIQFASLPETCKTVDARLESVAASKDSKGQVAGGMLTYALRLCDESAEYIDVVTAEWKSSTLEIKLINKNLGLLFQHVFNKIKVENSNCVLHLSSKKEIADISCTNFQLNLAGVSQALIKSASLFASQQSRFEFSADLYDDQTLKSHSQIKISSQGEVQIDLDEAHEIK